MAGVSILSSSRHVFGRLRRNLWRASDVPCFNPLVIEACLRPRLGVYRQVEVGGVSILSSSRHVFGHEGLLGDQELNREVSILSSSRHVFGHEGLLGDQELNREVSILSSSRHVFGQMDRSWGFSSRSLFQSSRHRGMSSAGMARPLPGQPSGRFQSSRHRGMSSASTRSSPTPRDNWMVSILSSSRHVFGQTMSRNEKTLWDVSILSSSRHVFGRVSMPCVEPMKIGSFNPLVIEACLRPPSTPRCPLRASRGFNPLVIEACLRPIPSRAR